MTEKTIHPPHVAYSAGVLLPEKHYQVVRNLRKFAETAGVPEELIYTALEKNVSKREIKFMEEQHLFFKHGKRGLLYKGKFKCSVLDRMSALIGCFVRNFVDGQVILMAELMEQLREGIPVEASVLAIPDFYVMGNGVGKKMYDADQSLLLSFMYRRANAKRLTLLYIEDYSKFVIDFGPSFAKITDTYEIIQSKEITI